VLTFNVGTERSTRVDVSSRGRPLTAASVVQRRDLGISISPSAGGYDCIVWGSVAARGKLPLQPAFLASVVEAARSELMKVVGYQNAAGDRVFQSAEKISEVDLAFALKTLARAGARLFQQLFFGPSAGADSKVIGEFLRKMASDAHVRLKFQILAETAPIPWGLLYMGDASKDANLNWNGFLGMRHIIEQIPLQTTLTISDNRIPSNQPELNVSVNVNSGIDIQMNSTFIAEQRAFWIDAQSSRQNIRLTQRSNRNDVVTALASTTTADQILYFYCHAASGSLITEGGADASCLVMTDAKITLGELNIDAPTTTMFLGNPLVFINACESANLSPAFYDGFVPYFMAKGARGVVGTECKTPAVFANAWARRFFERFLDGEPLGEVFLGLRREFFDLQRNPLGLLYAVYCDADTQIAPALTAIN
jgi:hypothetical protein